MAAAGSNSAAGKRRGCRGFQQYRREEEEEARVPTVPPGLLRKRRRLRGCLEPIGKTLGALDHGSDTMLALEKKMEDWGEIHMYSTMSK